MASRRLLAVTASLDPPMNPLRVAFDVGPLAGPRTGVGHAVAAMRDSVVDVDDVELVEYIVSFRSRPASGTRRLPLPAVAAHRLWAVADGPRVDHFLGKPDVVHGTNYVVPPCRAPQVVSVYDCWFLRHPTLAGNAVHQAGRVLRRAIERGATVHASSASTAAEINDLFPGAHVATIPLAAVPVPEATPDPPIPALVGRPFIAAIGTLERRKNLPTARRGVRARWPPNTTRSSSCSPAPMATTGRRSMRAIDAPRSRLRRGAW